MMNAAEVKREIEQLMDALDQWKVTLKEELKQHINEMRTIISRAHSIAVDPSSNITSSSDHPPVHSPPAINQEVPPPASEASGEQYTPPTPFSQPSPAPLLPIPPPTLRPDDEIDNHKLQQPITLPLPSTRIPKITKQNYKYPKPKKYHDSKTTELNMPGEAFMFDPPDLGESLTEYVNYLKLRADFTNHIKLQQLPYFLPPPPDEPITCFKLPAAEEIEERQIDEINFSHSNFGKVGKLQTSWLFIRLCGTIVAADNTDIGDPGINEFEIVDKSQLELLINIHLTSTREQGYVVLANKWDAERYRQPLSTDRLNMVDSRVAEFELIAGNKEKSGGEGHVTRFIMMVFLKVVILGPMSMDHERLPKMSLIPSAQFNKLAQHLYHFLLNNYGTLISHAQTAECPLEDPGVRAHLRQLEEKVELNVGYVGRTTELVGLRFSIARQFSQQTIAHGWVASRTDIGRKMFDEIEDWMNGIDRSIEVSQILISGPEYLDELLLVLGGKYQLACYIDHFLLSSAHELFDNMSARKVGLWVAGSNEFARYLCLWEAKWWFRQMGVEKFKPTSIVYSMINLFGCVLVSCRVHKVHQLQLLLAYRLTVVVYASIVYFWRAYMFIAWISADMLPCLLITTSDGAWYSIFVPIELIKTFKLYIAPAVVQYSEFWYMMILVGMVYYLSELVRPADSISANKSFEGWDAMDPFSFNGVSMRVFLPTGTCFYIHDFAGALRQGWVKHKWLTATKACGQAFSHGGRSDTGYSSSPAHDISPNHEGNSSSTVAHA